MNPSPSLWLMVVLIMFPQIVETIYSPALPDIASGFGVSVPVASQTLSVYFTAFAIGVVFWGVMSDWIGRRKTMLAGLTVYGVAALAAMQAQQFEALLLCRVLTAFGAAVGSVVTQTMLRDSCDRASLAKAFSYVGMGVSVSPVIGMLAGGVLTEYGGYPAVFAVLSLLAGVLWLLCLLGLPETRPREVARASLLVLGKRMVVDTHLWRHAILVAGFNVLLFSYYLQGPFVFARLGYSPQVFGYSGLILAAGTVVGSFLNKQWLHKGRSQNVLIQVASGLALAGAAGVVILQDSLWFLLPMLLIVVGYGMGIPNILSQSLQAYQAQAGSAGALFGLQYYLLIGVGLSVAGMTAEFSGFHIIIAVLMALLSLSVKATSMLEQVLRR
ncbi:multidrug effflux MFS transporter [Photobacterium sp. CAU 1568]|uniref:Multidrug effflux MFS transporter n=1 Tax=Photobacterium arenosum TaxID=2774143 RepID=A0ABR9BHT4_9GAMM|nr:multidrug effflux MFS transporter [Photobacterium arenosum]MBD8512113.1 multidrug effflux MFS transporter [Photobacterium arenosum]